MSALSGVPLQDLAELSMDDVWTYVEVLRKAHAKR